MGQLEIYNYLKENTPIKYTAMELRKILNNTNVRTQLVKLCRDGFVKRGLIDVVGKGQIIQKQVFWVEE